MLPCPITGYSCMMTKKVSCFGSQEDLGKMDVEHLQGSQRLVKQSTEMGELEAVEVLMSMTSNWRNRNVLRKELRPLTPFSDSSGEEPLLPGPALFPPSPCVSVHVTSLRHISVQLPC